LSDRLRLFFALWPEDHARTALAAAARAAQAQCGGRAMPAEKIHLTLFFIGSLDRARLGAIERAGAAVRGRAFELAFDRIGYFRRTAIVWAGASSTPDALLRLVETLRSRLAAEGVRGEARPYVPHVTLVRDAARRPTADVLTACTSRARAFALVQSVPVSGGVRYDNVATWPLGN